MRVVEKGNGVWGAVVAVACALAVAVAPWPALAADGGGFGGVPLELLLMGLAASATMLGGAAVLSLHGRSRLREAREFSSAHDFPFRTLVERAGPCLFTLTPDGVFSYVSKGGVAMFGYPADEVLGRHIADFVHPDDLDVCLRGMRSLVGRRRILVPVEYRFRHRDGSWRWHAVTADCVRKSDGRPAYFVGIATDVTLRRRADDRLRENESLLRDLLEVSPVGVAIARSKDGTILFANRRFAEMNGMKPGAAVGVQIGTLCADETMRRSVAARMARDGQVGDAEVRYRRVDGSEYDALLSAGFLSYENDTAQLIWLYDITERKRMEEELRLLATTDSLTGVANRRSFVERTEREIARARRYGNPLSLLLIDADHFKQINDTHGHQVGDEVLRRLSRACCERLREIDIIGRLGGEEFGITLPDTDLDGAADVAERLRAALAALKLDAAGRSVAVTVSIGVATLSGDGNGLDQLLSAADDALYRAKGEGRDQVVLAPVASGLVVPAALDLDCA